MTPRTPRKSLYKAARELGDIQAAERGPAALVKRRARRAVYRRSNGLVRSVLRSVGL